MNVSTYLYKNNKLENSRNADNFNQQTCQLVIGFGEKNTLSNSNPYDLLRDLFPKATIALCSTAGEIYNSEVLDDSLSVTAIEFNQTKYSVLNSLISILIVQVLKQALS